MLWVVTVLLGVVVALALLLAIWRLGSEWTRLSLHRMDNQRMIDLIDVGQEMEELETRAKRLVQRGKNGGAAA